MMNKNIRNVSSLRNVHTNTLRDAMKNVCKDCRVEVVTANTYNENKILKIALCDRNLIGEDLEFLTYGSIEFNDVNETYAIVIKNKDNTAVASCVITSDIAANKLPHEVKTIMHKNGFTITHLRQSCIEIALLCSHPKHRIKHAVKTMMDSLIKKTTRCIILFIAKHQENPTAMNFYQSIGFQQIGNTNCEHHILKSRTCQNVHDTLKDNKECCLQI